MTDFPEFWYDANCVGLVHVKDRETFDKLAADMKEAGYGRGGISSVLDARQMLKVRSYRDVGLPKGEVANAEASVGMEMRMQHGAPNFGWRREHGGDVCLGEWLRAMHAGLVPDDWEPLVRDG